MQAVVFVFLLVVIFLINPISVLTWSPIYIWSSISQHQIKLCIWRESQIPQSQFGLFDYNFCTKKKWTTDRSFIRTSEVVVKNTISSIHCLGNNDRFKQLLLENISSAKMSDANGWSSSIKPQDTIALFYQGCRQAYFNLYVEPTEALREGTD